MKIAEQQLEEAINYILEITNDDIGAGDTPVSFLIATHRVLMTHRRELLKALKEVQPYIYSEDGKRIAKDAIASAEYMVAK